MTIDKLITWAIAKLKKSGIKNSLLDAEIILIDVIGKNREWFYANKDYILNKKTISKYKELISRRSKREPTAYILGNKEFYGLNFIVNKDVLIPRPETEELVELAVKTINNYQLTDSKKRLEISDIGTGSGCIAISLVKEIDKLNKNLKFKIVATDISKKALKVAQKNAKIHRVSRKIKFIKSDMIRQIKGGFDIIISNPPYVEKREKIEKELYFEPKNALFVYPKMWRNLLSEISQKLNKKGIAFLEICPKSKTKIKKIIKKENFKMRVDFAKDQWNKTRYAILKKTL